MPHISSNGIKINYETVGYGDPLLLIMGFGMPGAAWAPMLPFLAGFQAIYFDNRGTGLSDKPAGAYTVAEMAEDASNLLRSLGLERVRVYGISMGGMIAQELALRHPEQVGSMVLGCTTPGGTEGVRGSDEVLQSLVTGSKLMAQARRRHRPGTAAALSAGGPRGASGDQTVHAHRDDARAADAPRDCR